MLSGYACCGASDPCAPIPVRPSLCHLQPAAILSSSSSSSLSSRSQRGSGVSLWRPVCVLRGFSSRGPICKSTCLSSLPLHCEHGRVPCPVVRIHDLHSMEGFSAASPSSPSRKAEFPSRGVEVVPAVSTSACSLSASQPHAIVDSPSCGMHSNSQPLEFKDRGGSTGHRSVIDTPSTWRGR